MDQSEETDDMRNARTDTEIPDPPPISETPPVPDWTDVPNFADTNGNGDRLTETDLKVHDLEQWLRVTFERELPGTLAKARQYGSADLEVMAGAMMQVMPMLKTHEQGLQAAIAFYNLGKVARVFGALCQGEDPHPDCNYDSHIYALMGLKVGETGRWL
jgi:hypothetical protein